MLEWRQEKRKKVLESKNTYEFADNFLNQIVQELIKYKRTNVDIDKKLITIFGSVFNDSENNNLKTQDDTKVQSQILYKFKNKRDERVSMLGKTQSEEFEKRILLQLIDQNWQTHLQYLEQIRQVIGLRSYGQRDPLIEYKKEAFNLFEDLLEKIKNQFITLLLNIKIISESITQEETRPISQNSKCLLVLRKGTKISRNEVCPASNKKYKNCCGAL